MSIVGGKSPWRHDGSSNNIRPNDGGYFETRFMGQWDQLTNLENNKSMTDTVANAIYKREQKIMEKSTPSIWDGVMNFQLSY